MTSGYNGNGRPKVEIQQREGRPWTGNVFNIKTPDGRRYEGLGPYGVVEILTSYPAKPVPIFGSHVTGAAKNFFRSAISDMPLPVALQEA